MTPELSIPNVSTIRGVTRSVIERKKRDESRFLSDRTRLYNQELKEITKNISTLIQEAAAKGETSMLYFWRNTAQTQRLALVALERVLSPILEQHGYVVYADHERGAIQISWDLEPEDFT